MFFSFNYRFEIWYIIICTISNGIKTLISTRIETKNQTNKTNIAYLISTVKYCATIFHIIFYIIEKILSKTHFSLDEEKLTKKKKFLSYKKQIYLIIVNFFFFFIYVFCSNSIKKYKNRIPSLSEFTIYNLLLLIIDIFFYTKIYYPHYILTLIIFLLVSIFIVVFEILNSKNILNTFLIFHIYFYKNYTATFALFIFKILNTSFFMSIFLIIFFEGISKISSLLFFGFLDKKRLTIPNSTLDIILLFIYFLACVIYTFTKCKIIQNLRPTHFGLSLYVYYLLLPIFNLKFNFIISEISIGIISFFGCLIYSEILIFHCLNLDKKTKNFFLKKLIYEMEKIPEI